MNAGGELKFLLEETVAGLGGTDQSYVQLLHYLQDQNELYMPSRFLPGQMVFFKYKPQDKRFLGSYKAYDVFPLVIITDVHKDGFEGLNLHFISKKWRKALFTAIETDLPVKRMGNESLTRLGATYKRMDGLRKFAFFRPCYRRYVREGFRKRPILIPKHAWDVLVDVDLALFVKGRKMGIRRMAYNSVISRDNT
jgi:hypothetical protein